MKKIFVFLGVMILTFSILFFLKESIVKTILSPKEEYHLNTSVNILLNDKMPQDNIVICDNEQNLTCDIDIENKIDEMKQFEIIVLCNYSQVPYKNEDGKEILCDSFRLKSSKIHKKIVIDKNNLAYADNSLIVIIRQDTEKYEDNEDMIDEYKTLKFVYNVKNADASEEYNDTEEAFDLSNCYREKDDISNKKIFIRNNYYEDKNIIEEEAINSFILEIESFCKETNLVMAFVNSEQIMINGKKALYIECDENTRYRSNIDLFIPEISDSADLELICIPLVSEANIYDMQNIKSSNKFVIKVEKND